MRPWLRSTIMLDDRDYAAVHIISAKASQHLDAYGASLGMLTSFVYGPPLRRHALAPFVPQNQPRSPHSPSQIRHRVLDPPIPHLPKTRLRQLLFSTHPSTPSLEC